MEVIIFSAFGLVWLLLNNSRKKHEAARSNSQPKQNNPVSNISPPSFPDQDNLVSLEVNHGTSRKNAEAILNEHGAFKLGGENAFANGLHMTTNRNEARKYAKNGGKIIKMHLNCPPGQIADYDSVFHSREFKNWKKEKKINNDSSAVTRYCTEVLGKRFLKVDKHHYVALSNKGEDDERVLFEGLNFEGIEDA